MLTERGSWQEATDPDTPEQVSVQPEGDGNPHCPSQVAGYSWFPITTVTLVPGYCPETLPQLPLSLYFCTPTPSPEALASHPRSLISSILKFFSSG